jgi:hypothetical protein
MKRSPEVPSPVKAKDIANAVPWRPSYGTRGLWLEVRYFSLKVSVAGIP